jgi:thiol-disulfide isomerase/thioredoxin
MPSRLLSPVRLTGRAALAMLLASLLLVCAPAAPAVRADTERLIPWKDDRTPPLSLADLAGRRHSLADYRGQVVLVNFWATWCDPCREEMPSMQRLRQRLAGRPFAVLAVNHGESPARAGDFLKRARLDLPVLLDPGQETARAWRVRILPHSFLLGPDGRVRYSVIGELDWASDPVVEAVRRLLPGS